MSVSDQPPTWEIPVAVEPTFADVVAALKRLEDDLRTHSSRCLGQHADRARGIWLAVERIPLAQAMASLKQILDAASPAVVDPVMPPALDLPPPGPEFQVEPVMPAKSKWARPVRKGLCLEWVAEDGEIIYGSHDTSVANKKLGISQCDCGKYRTGDTIRKAPIS